MSSSATNTNTDAVGGRSPPSNDEAAADDDAIGALIYQQSRTGQALARKERWAARTAALFCPVIATTGGAEACQETRTAHPSHHDSVSHGAAVQRGKKTETRDPVRKVRTTCNKSIPIKSFEERLGDLRAYKARHGHTNARRSADTSLAKVCSTARWSRRNPDTGTMYLSEEGIAALDALGHGLGFNWMKRRQFKSFEERLEQLKEYKAKHGHLRVKKSEDKSLAQFCTNARRDRRCPQNGCGLKMTQERIAALDAIGFDWATRQHPTHRRT